MEISYDPDKNTRNIVERSLSFDRVADFDFDTAKLWQDTRRTYPENRFVAIGYLDGRLHVLVFSETEHGIRVISFRKANAREGEHHGFTLSCS
ncbi:BrnT family toxin [Rhodocyclaceae bacterium]